MTALDGLAAIVTGGASGIGAATVRALREAGARVIALDREESNNDDVRVLRVDVRDRAEVERAVAAAATELGGIDIVVNCAGIGALGTVADNDDGEWARVLDINVVGTARVVAAALPFLRRSAAASVVNVASIAATAGLPDRALYSASKGAVQALTLAMAADHVREGIRVNCVNPGTVDTPFVQRNLEQAADREAELAALRARQPTGRLVTAEEVAAAIVFLAGPGAASITGTAVAIDGGMSGLRLRAATR